MTVVASRRHPPVLATDAGATGHSGRPRPGRMLWVSAVSSERLLEDHPCAGGATRGGGVGDDRVEERGRDGQVVQRMAGIAKLAAKGLKRRWVFVGALDVAKPFDQAGGSWGVGVAVRGDAQAGPFAEGAEVS